MDTWMMSSENTQGGFMCGILGVSSPAGMSRLSQQVFLRMRESMISRGPDAAGYYAHENLQLGHRRLAIRDPELGQQPWFSPSGRYVLIYNGEIYNDQQLRDELQQQNYQFKTRCDTETLLAGYEVWGANVFAKINGMFACLIYDHQNKELVMARDPLGIKPLFYSYQDGSFIVASTIKAILGHPSVSREYDFVSISHYLSTFRLTLGERTLYQDIKQLKPGWMMTFKKQRLEFRKYSNLFTPKNKHNEIDCSLDDAQELVDAALSQAVNSQLQSDVKVGLFLSGGLDSTLIAHYQKQAGNDPIHSFFIQGDANSKANSRVIKYASGKFQRIDQAHHEQTSYDHSTSQLHDQQIANLCAKQHDFVHHNISLAGQDYLKLWKHLIAETCLPLTTPSDPLIYLMSLHARQHVGVVLGGEGADEFFFGYQAIQPRGHDYDILKLLCLQDPEGKNETTKSFLRQFQKQYGNQAQYSLARFYFQIASSLAPEKKTSLLSPEFISLSAADQPIWDYYESILNDQSGISGIGTLLQQMNLESLLGRLDSNTMLAGIEARVPYTDLNLIQLADNLPLKFKMTIQASRSMQLTSTLEHQGEIETKRVLRSLADRYYPVPWNHRPKGSFPTPVFTWLAESWWPEIQHLLHNNRLMNEMFKQPDLKDLLETSTKSGPLAWALINLAFWDEIVSDNESANKNGAVPSIASI